MKKAQAESDRLEIMRDIATYEERFTDEVQLHQGMKLD